MNTNLNTLHHIGVIVSDMERSMRFYAKLIGVKPKTDTTISGPALWRQTQVEGATMRIVFFDLDNGGTGLELIEFTDQKGELANSKQNTIGNVHFAFNVKDANQAYVDLKNDGYEFIDVPQHMDEHYGQMKGYTFAYLRGPDNELIEIIQNPSLIEKLLG